jgi:hypothetical protein
VSLGEFTKQLAKEALGAQVDEVVDSLRGKETASADTTSAAAGPADALAVAIIAQVQAMQNALKEDQELAVHCAAGRDTVRVFEMYAPSPRLLVLTGADSERAMTRIVSAADAVQLVCRPVTVKEGAKPLRLKFVVPKPKSA